MGYPAYIVTNCLNSSTIVTPATEDAAYPTENLFDQIAANPYRAASRTALSLLFDFGYNITADTVALINHNLTSAAVVTLKAAATSPPATLVSTLTWREHDMWAAFTDPGRRYYLLEASDPTNPDYLEIGELVIGARVALPRGYRYGYTPSVKANNLRHQTEGGVVWAYQRYIRDEIGYAFRVLAAEKATFLAWYNACQGEVTPCVFIEDTSEAGMLYCRMQADFLPSELDNKAAFDIALTLIAESRGLSITA